MFKEIEHTADLGIYIESCSLEGLFYDATIGMLQMTNIDFSKGNELITENIKIISFDYETLLIDWLNEIIYKLNNHLYLLNFKIKIDNLTLMNYCWFKKIPDIFCNIKSATYNNLNIISENRLYKCTLIFDM